MDLGATLRTRRQPFCGACPMHELCLARRSGRQAELLVRCRAKLPERATTLMLLTDGQRVLVERRPPAGIWGGLLSLPEGDADDPAEFVRRHGCRLLDTQALPLLKHTFTHFRLNIETLLCRVEGCFLVCEAGDQWLAYAAIETAALPTPVRRLLRLAAELPNGPGH